VRPVRLGALVGLASLAVAHLGALAALASLAVAIPAPLSAQHAQPSPDRSIRSFLDSLKRDPNGITLSPDAVQSGPRTVAAKDHVTGDVAAWKGPLDIYGTVDGNAVAIGGDVIVHPGATVRGEALSVGGSVKADGIVGGDMRTLSGLSIGPLAVHSRTPAQAARRSFSLAVGWYLMLALVGLGITLFARSNLEAVAQTIREDFARAFLFGVLGEVALTPAFVLGCVALAITLIGIIAIPFFAVAFVAAAAGAIALGFVATAFLTGESVLRRREAATLDASSTTLQYLFIGLSIFFVLWALGGAMAWAGLFGSFVRVVVACITWAAVTVGFGATLLSRAGTRGHHAPAPRPLTHTEEYAWQTPTPVTGVAAARRPTPAPRPPEQ